MSVIFNNPTVRRGGIVKEGLVLNLDAKDLYSYPRSGTKWYDLSGNENHGTMNVTIPYNEDAQGSLVWDGNIRYVTCSIPQTNQITISFWTKKNSYNYTNSGFFLVSPPGSTTPTSSGSKVLGGWSDTTGRIWGRIIDTTVGSNNLPVDANFKIDLDVWTNIVYVANGINYTVYKNAVSGVSTSYGGTISSYDKIFIGAQGSEYYDGKFANFYVYNRALKLDEINQNFQATRGRFGI